MPLLNATGAPYTGVPTVSTPPDAGGQTQRISADPTMFGALQGAATSQLGRTLESAGDQFAQIAIQRQGIFNDIAATEAGNATTESFSKILYGDPNKQGDVGYYGTVGRAAMDKWEESRNAVDAAFTQARSQLQNPQQQLKFDAEMRRQRAYTLSAMGRHYDEQSKKYAEDTYKGSVTLKSNGMSAASAQGNFEAFQQFLGEGLQKIDEAGKTFSRPPEAVEADKAAYRATAVKSWTEGLAANGDANAALTFLRNNREHVAKEEYPQLIDKYEKRATTQEADRIAARVKQGLPPENVRRGASGIPLSEYTPPSSEISNLISQSATKHGVDENVIKALFHEESRFRQSATSYKGARGVAQLMEGTAKELEVDREDLGQNIDGGVRRFKQMLDKSGGDIGKAVRMYNAGPNGDLNGPEPTKLAAAVLARLRGEDLTADFAKSSGTFGTPEEAARNLVTVSAPGGASFRVHKLAAPQIQGFINDLEATGYKIDPGTSGGYNNRNKVGVNSTEKSEHAFGGTIDINRDRNPQGDTLVTDLPSNVQELAAKWGLKWGGTFEGKKDAMHFEVARILPNRTRASASVTAPGGIVEAGTLDPAAIPGGPAGLSAASPVKINDGPLKGKFVLLPGMAADGSILPLNQILDEYDKGHKHLGVFNSEKEAVDYGRRLAARR